MSLLNRWIRIVVAVAMIASILYVPQPFHVEAEFAEGYSKPQIEILSEQYGVKEEVLQGFLYQGYTSKQLIAALTKGGIDMLSQNISSQKHNYAAVINPQIGKVISYLGGVNYALAADAAATGQPTQVQVDTKPDQAPFTVQLNQESISTTGGNLTYNATDLTLPGRNGLSFALTRTYDSGASQSGQMYVDYYIQNQAEGKSYEEKLYPIGKGWSWQISSIEHAADGKMYLHLSGGGTYEIVNDQLKNYPWKDIEFKSDTTVTVNGEKSIHRVKFVNGISQYYNSTGRLLQISDNYDNKILFKYTNESTFGVVLTEIEDALGNKIQIRYSKNMIELQQGDRFVTYHYTEQNGIKLLRQVVDPLNRPIAYDYSLMPAKFNLLGTTPTTDNPYTLLMGINYPTGAKTVYSYETSPIIRYIGERKVNQVYRMLSRKDVIKLVNGTSEDKNVKTITYSGDMGSSYSEDMTFSVSVNDGLTTTVYENMKDYIDTNTSPVFYKTKAIVTGGDTTQVTSYTYDEPRKWYWPISSSIVTTQAGKSSAPVVTSQMYDDYQNTIYQTDALGHQTRYTYDATTHLLANTAVDIDSMHTRYTEFARNAQGSITKVTTRENNAFGNILHETFLENIDANGNVRRVRDTEGSSSFVTDYEYSPIYANGYQTKEIHQVTNTDPSTGTPINETITREYTYDKSNGNVLSIKDGSSQITTYQYDALGRLKSYVHPDNSAASFTYYDNLNIVEVKDETGVTAYSQYNPLGWLEQAGIVGPIGRLAKQKTGYDSNGRAIWTEDAIGNRTQMTYDNFSRQVQVIAPDTSITSMSYDDVNLTQKVTDAEGNATLTQLDKLGQVLSQSENIGGQTTLLITNSYNYIGQKVSVTQAGNKTSAVYDILGRLTQVTEPNQETTSYTYNALGLQTSTIYPDQKVSSRTYDELGRVIKTTDASNKQELFVYDKNSNLIRLVDRKGIEFSYTYSANNLLLAKNVVGFPNEKISYSYDAAGRRKSMTDPTGSTLYNYSPITGELLDIKYPDGRSIKYSYNANGNRNQMIDPFNGNLYYEYDAKNQLVNLGTSIGKWDAQYSYYKNGQLKTTKQLNGVESSMMYKGYKLDTIVQKKSDGSLINQFSYQYDTSGNITSKTENNQSHQFTYDALNRIQTNSQYNESYSYDARGNRKTMTSSSNFDSPDGTYTYDHRNQLIAVTTPASTVNYKYNGDGLLYERTSDGTTTRYYYDGDQVVAEATIVNGSAQLKARYIRGMSLVAREDASRDKAYYLQNGHGDTVALMDQSGTTKLNEYQYNIWGNPTTKRESVSNPFLYSGEMWDSTTELQYLRARWYNPSLGRFINEDTYEGDITNPLTLNLYTYVYNNPLGFTDPSGNMGRPTCANWDDVCMAKGEFDRQLQIAHRAPTIAAVEALADNLLNSNPVGTGVSGTVKSLGYLIKYVSGILKAVFAESKTLKVINLGAGDNIIQGVINTDVKTGKGIDLALDATKALPYADESIDAFISINPFRYAPINEFTSAALKPGGTFTLVGQYGNPWFKTYYTATAEQLKTLGYELVWKGQAEEAYKYGTKTTTGNNISADSLYQIELRKLGE